MTLTLILHLNWILTCTSTLDLNCDLERTWSRNLSSTMTSDYDYLWHNSGVDLDFNLVWLWYGLQILTLILIRTVMKTCTLTLTRILTLMPNSESTYDQTLTWILALTWTLIWTLTSCSDSTHDFLTWSYITSLTSTSDLSQTSTYDINFDFEYRLKLWLWLQLWITIEWMGSKKDVLYEATHSNG
jgi:hypothetical protein